MTTAASNSRIGCRRADVRAQVDARAEARRGTIQAAIVGGAVSSIALVAATLSFAVFAAHPVRFTSSAVFDAAAVQTGSIDAHGSAAARQLDATERRLRARRGYLRLLRDRLSALMDGDDFAPPAASEAAADDVEIARRVFAIDRAALADAQATADPTAERALREGWSREMVRIGAEVAAIERALVEIQRRRGESDGRR